MEIPSSLLIRFFQEATKAMTDYESSSCVCSLSTRRKELLELQLKCLARVVEDNDNDDTFTVEQVQLALKELGTSETIDDSVHQAMNDMNEAARLAFCRLVLHDECQWDADDDNNNKSLRNLNNGDTPMSRADLVEYAGLVNGVVRLPNVQQHLRDASPLFEDAPQRTAASIFCQKRLERIQQLLLRAVGYEIEFGKTEIERYYHGNETLDAELVQILNQLSSNMTVAIMNAETDSTTKALTDRDQGGVTRVVSVSYSEKILSPDGREISSTAAPTQESMQEHNADEQLSQLKMAQQAASLEQSILDGLMSLSEEDRGAKLEMAREAHEDFVARAMGIPAGPERIAFLTSVAPEKQQLLLIHKLWAKVCSDKDENAPATS